MRSGGMNKGQLKIIGETEQLLDEARHDPHFAESMKARGYTEESWTHGQDLLTAAKSAGRAKEEAESAKLGATNAFERQRDQLWRQSSMLAKTCETMFQGQTECLNALGLHGKRKDGNGTSEISKPNKTGKLDVVVNWQRNLYETAQNKPEIASVLAANGFPAEMLAQGAAGVETLVQINHQQERAKAAVTQRSKERDAAFKTLTQWLRCAQRAAELAREESERSLLGGSLRVG